MAEPALNRFHDSSIGGGGGGGIESRIFESLGVKFGMEISLRLFVQKEIISFLFIIVYNLFIISRDVKV